MNLLIFLFFHKIPIYNTRKIWNPFHDRGNKNKREIWDLYKIFESIMLWILEFKIHEFMNLKNYEFMKLWIDDFMKLWTYESIKLWSYEFMKVCNFLILVFKAFWLLELVSFLHFRILRILQFLKAFKILNLGSPITYSFREG